MSREAKADVLRQTETFAERNAVEVESLAAAAEDLVVAPGTVLDQESHPADRCYVIVSGEASLVAAGAIVGSLGPGSIVGDLSGPRMTVTATTLMHLLVLPAEAVWGKERT